MTTRIHELVLAGFALAATLTLAVPTAAQSDQLALLKASREASGVREHADLARRFRLQAEAFDATATAHEAEAARLSRNAPGIVHKWPSMAPPAMNRARQQAVEARRSALESRVLADRHLRLSVEAQADPRPVGD